MYNSARAAEGRNGCQNSCTGLTCSPSEPSSASLWGHCGGCGHRSERGCCCYGRGTLHQFWELNWSKTAGGKVGVTSWSQQEQGCRTHEAEGDLGGGGCCWTGSSSMQLLLQRTTCSIFFFFCIEMSLYHVLLNTTAPPALCSPLSAFWSLAALCQQARPLPSIPPVWQNEWLVVRCLARVWRSLRWGQPLVGWVPNIAYTLKTCLSAMQSNISSS